MYIYLFLLIIIIFLFSLDKKNKKTALFLSFILITLVASIRKYTVGVDTQQFYSAFIAIGNTPDWDYTTFRYEPGFFYLCKILNMISSDPQILLIVTSIFINFSVYRFIKKNSNNYILSVILYVIMNIFFSYMNIMRQALAIAVLLYGFDLLKNKKYIKYTIVVLLATLFHDVSWSSMLLIIFAILPNKKLIYGVAIVVTAILFFEYDILFEFLTSIFGHKEYSNSVFGESNYFGSLLSFLQCFFIIGINYLYIILNRRKEFLYESDKMHILTVSTIIYLCFMLLTMRMNIYNRISGLYSIYCIITIPELLAEIKRIKAKDYYLINFVSIGTYIASFLIIGYYRPEWSGCIPYTFFWK